MSDLSIRQLLARLIVNSYSTQYGIAKKYQVRPSRRSSPANQPACQPTKQQKEDIKNQVAERNSMDYIGNVHSTS